ncbi:hypothetical protein AVEN_39322-1, partial [Araneus ventricosus]
MPTTLVHRPTHRVKVLDLGRRAIGSRPDSTRGPSGMGPVARQIMRSGQTSSRWCGSEVWRRGASS